MTRQQACITAGVHSVYMQSKGTTSKEQEAKRQSLKNAVRDWALLEFPGEFTPDVNDGVTDALAVGVYAGYNWQRELMIAAATPKPLFGPGSRGGKVSR